MLFMYRKQKYGVQFKYDGISTTAELIRYDNNEPMPTNIVGSVSCYYKDNYSKILGRKRALAKLLKRMNEKSAGMNKPEFRLTKKIRAYIWQEYFKTHRMV